jgi:putative ABC transport system permease protein
MLRSYLTIAFRNAQRDSAFFLLNVLGLSIGLSFAILVLLFVQREFSYDQHHVKADRIHRVFVGWREEGGGTSYHYAAQGPVVPTLIEEFPEVEDGTRFMRRVVNVSAGNQEGAISQVLVGDDRFFHVFDYETVEGDLKTDLASPGTGFVTQSLARKLFGDASPIGKSVTLTSKFFDDTYTVTGILEDPPKTSTLDLAPDFITLTIPRKSPELMTSMWEQWENGFITTQSYIVLRENASPSAVRGKLTDFVHRHWNQDWVQWVSLEMIPLTEMYLYGRARFGLSFLTGDIQICYTLGVIGALIAVVACINFMNLATARSAKRVREVGMRKVSGARRMQLVAQFMGESILIALIATTAALGVVALALPTVNGFMHLDLAISVDAVYGLSVLAFVVGILSGTYPALFLSSFPPASAFRASLDVKSGHGRIRKGLVVCQFAVSMSLVVATLVVIEQTQYMQNADPGYDPEALVVVPERISSNGPLMKERLAQVPGVLGVSLLHMPLMRRTWVGGDSVPLVTEGRDTLQVPIIFGDEDFLSLYQIPVVEGRNFLTEEVRLHSNSGSGIGNTSKIMLNQTGATHFGIQAGDVVNWYKREWQVIGIFADFHYDSFREPIGPVVLIPVIHARQVSVNLRIATGDIQGVIERASEAWTSVAPERPFAYEFMDDAIADAYAKERLLGRLSSLCAALAITIACLGLLGLIAYTAETRTREVGIRKVLGASETGIVGLLCKEFVILVAVAGLIACPVVWWVMNKWLNEFAYRIEVGPVPFIASVVGAILIALATISWQAISAARANPVDALRSR